jgi:hypothetical protein
VHIGIAHTIVILLDSNRFIYIIDGIVVALFYIRNRIYLVYFGSLALNMLNQL